MKRARRASAPPRPAGRVAGLGPRLRPAWPLGRRRGRGRRAAPGVRGGLRRRARAARSRTTTSTAWCCAAQPARARDRGAARLCASTCGRSASRCRSPSSRARWPPMPAWRARWSNCSSCASTRSRRPTRRRARKRRCARSRPRWTTWPTCPKTACCATTWRSIQATPRTNYWRRDAAGRRRDFLSFKFDAAKVPDLPAPKPLFEIFVYSTRFEGVHLRGGRGRAGGLRWSDRPEDFRTEVLGLVKAQMVKNTVIVPVGSKGGFVLKRAPRGERPRGLSARGRGLLPGPILRGLLDITDNLRRRRGSCRRRRWPPR